MPTTKLRHLLFLLITIYYSNVVSVQAQCPLSFSNTNQGVINLLLGSSCEVTFDASTRVTVQGNCGLVYFKNANMTLPYAALPMFTGANLGQTIEVYVSTDDGNPSTPSPTPLKFTLKIVDTNKPIVNCPLNQAYIADATSCNKVITSDLTAVATDNCGGSVSLVWATTGATNSTGTNSMIGKTINVGRSIVTYSATDASGNIGTCSFTIDMSEIVAPTVVSCPSDMTLDAVANACQRIVVVGVTPSYSDNCTSVNNITLAYEFSGATEKTATGSAANSIFKVGKTLVTYTASDAFANTNKSCSFNVAIRDIEKPQVICPSDLSLNTTADSCFTYITSTNLTPLSLDNCGQNNLTTNFALSGAVQTATLSLQSIVNQRFAKGVTTVLYTVSDAAGNTNTCTQRINISDKTKPKINCNSSHIQTATPNAECQKLVSLAHPSSSDNCTSQQNIALLYSLEGAVMASGSGLIPPNQLFVPGLTTVTYKVTDESGNFAECAYNVTVIEAPFQKPTLQCPANVTVSATNGTCHASINSGLQPQNASDNCTTIDLLKMRVSLSGATIQADSFVPVSRGANGFVFNVGKTKVRYILTDASNNSDTCFMDVLVLDKQRPVIDFAADLTLNASNGCTRRVLGLKPKANDNCSPNDLQFSYTLSGATAMPILPKPIDSIEFRAGVTTVRFVVKDSGDNIDSTKFDVTILESVVPTIVCPNDLTVNTSDTSCTAILQNIPSPQLGDNCTAIVDLSLSFATSGASSLTGKNNINGSVFNHGKTNVTYTVSDFSKNTAQCSFSVSVKDATLPKIVCPNNITINAYDTTCYAFVKSPDVTFSDNCSASLSYVISEASTLSGNGLFAKAQLNIGKNLVTYRATDADGNTAQCAFEIFVKDITSPKITCPSNAILFANADNCEASAPIFSPTMSDNCDTLDLKFSASGVTNIEPTNGILTARNFTVGKSIVTFTVSDIQSNTATCSMEIEVQDKVKPTAKCRQGMTVALDMSGISNLNGMVFDNGSSDNCTSVNNLLFTATKERFDCSNIGQNSVTMTVKDAAGNSAACVATLTIVNSFSSLKLSASATATTESYWGATNGSVAASVTGGLGDFDFLWNNSATTATQGDLPTGVYIVTVTDKVSKCSATTSVTLPAGPKMKLIAGNLIGTSGTTVLVPVRVQNFNKIKDLQFSMTLKNKAIATLESLQDFGINTTDSLQYNISNGVIYFKKAFAKNTGLSLPNGTALFYVKVKLTGAVGNFSPIEFAINPADLLVKQFLPQGLISIPLSLQNGSVGISNGASTAKINGKIQREDGAALKDVKVYLSGTYEDSLTTKTDGLFEYDLPLGAKVSLKTKREGDVREGLNAIDAVLLQRHILGYINMSSEYKKIAGDVNKSGTLSALDVAEIKRVILGYQAGFRVPTWQFVPADYAFPTLDQNRVLSAPDTIILPYLLNNHSNQNFIAIKTADLNLSANLNASAPRSIKTLTLQVEDKAYAKGEIVDLAFSTARDIDLSALQAALHLDNSKLEIIKMQNVDLEHFSESDKNMSQAQKGDIRLAWTNPKRQKITAKSNLFSIQCKVLADVNSLKNLISLDEKTMSALAYEAEQEQRVVLELVKTESSETDISVYPNPCAAGFVLAVSSAISAILYDVQGRVVAQYDLVNKAMPFAIATHALPEGLYHLKVQQEGINSIKKIIVTH